MIHDFLRRIRSTKDLNVYYVLFMLHLMIKTSSALVLQKSAVFAFMGINRDKKFVTTKNVTRWNSVENTHNLSGYITREQSEIQQKEIKLDQVNNDRKHAASFSPLCHASICSCGPMRKQDAKWCLLSFGWILHRIGSTKMLLLL